MEQKKAIRTRDGFRVTHINRRRACRLMCAECMGWSDAEVNNCDGKMLDGSTCPLVDYRNMKGNQNAKKRNKAVRSFCMECVGGNIADVVRCKSIYCPIYPYRNTRTDKSVLFDRDIDEDKIMSLMSA